MHRRSAASHRPALCIVLVALAAAAAFSCGPDSNVVARRPNLLLISIDALRADRLEAYGYQRPTSPFLAELGRRGLVYENAFVNTHGTTPSHTTILSGLYQETHGVGLASSEPNGVRPDGAGGVVGSRIPDTVELLPEILRAHGYTTIGVTDGGNAGAAFGFARGFDHFDDRGGGIVKVSRRVVRMLSEARTDAPIFVFLHTYEVHSPYRPRPETRALFGVSDDVPAANNDFLLEHAATAATTLTTAELAAISGLYDAEIRETDDQLRAFFDRLDGLGFLRDAVVLVTADHGEEFGEHGGLLHRDLLYDVLIKVPLILTGPGLDPGRPVGPVSSVDIAPTLLQLAGVPVPSAMEGAPLPGVGSGPGAGNQRRAGAAGRGGELRAGGRRAAVVAQYSNTRYAIRTLDWKLIWSAPGTIELFDLDADPGEQENVVALHPEVAATLGAALERWRERHRGGAEAGQPVELSPQEWRELESLGYVR